MKWFCNYQVIIERILIRCCRQNLWHAGHAVSHKAVVHDAIQQNDERACRPRHPNIDVVLLGVPISNPLLQLLLSLYLLLLHLVNLFIEHPSMLQDFRFEMLLGHHEVYASIEIVLLGVHATIQELHHVLLFVPILREHGVLGRAFRIVWEVALGFYVEFFHFFFIKHLLVYFLLDGVVWDPVFDRDGGWTTTAWGDSWPRTWLGPGFLWPSLFRRLWVIRCHRLIQAQGVLSCCRPRSLLVVLADRSIWLFTLRASHHSSIFLNHIHFLYLRLLSRQYLILPSFIKIQPIITVYQFLLDELHICSFLLLFHHLLRCFLLLLEFMSNLWHDCISVARSYNSKSLLWVIVDYLEGKMIMHQDASVKPCSHH